VAGIASGKNKNALAMTENSDLYVEKKELTIRVVSSTENALKASHWSGIPSNKNKM